jgi:predicted aspartyl protease
MKGNLNRIQPIAIALVVVGSLAIGGIVSFAIARDYQGSFNLRFGVDGVQVEFNGNRDTPPLK